MKWLYYVMRIFFCPHQYEVYKGVDRYSPWFGVPQSVYVSRCKKCGKMKEFKI